MRKWPLLLAAAVAIGLLVANGLRESAVYFRFPSELTAEERSLDSLRLGGMVAAGSVERAGTSLRFVLVDDGPARVEVRYEGLVPDLFGEGQGAVVEGAFGPDGVFVAHTVMVKHGEDYTAGDGEHPDREGIRERFGTGIPGG